MPDREKVIKGLECCKRKDGNECKVCPYTESEYCTEDMVTDALALLKESVSQAVVDQIRWERDTVLSQLKEIGKGFGEKMDDIVALLKEQQHDVLCRDCTHYENCEIHDLLLNHENGYCSDGERRDGP